MNDKTTKKSTGKPATPSNRPKKAAPATVPEASPNPLDMEGGRRSDVDGKFEADHRPSR